jgi:hypothetical protein
VLSLFLHSSDGPTPVGVIVLRNTVLSQWVCVSTMIASEANLRLPKWSTVLDSVFSAV